MDPWLKCFVQCSGLCFVQCTVSSVYCSVQCSAVYSTLHSAVRCTVHCTVQRGVLYTAQCSAVYCTLHSAARCTVQCTVQGCMCSVSRPRVGARDSPALSPQARGRGNRGDSKTPCCSKQLGEKLHTICSYGKTLELKCSQNF